MIDAHLPLFIGSPRDTAIINPDEHMRLLRRRAKAGRVRLPKSGVITFGYMKEFLEQVRAQPGIREHSWYSRNLLDFKAGRRRIACFAMNCVGCPAAAMRLEHLIALGLERVVLVGGVGVLSDSIPTGSLIIPTVAIRDEGTSHHYLSPGWEVGSDGKLTRSLLESCRKHGVEPLCGKTWTTDAFYRETFRRIKHFRARGAICVEMEAAACFAVARYRGVRAAALLRAADSVAGKEWNPRNGKSDAGKRAAADRIMLRIVVDALLMDSHKERKR